MIEVTKGMLAKSKAGHDKNRIYYILDFDDVYVYLIDGVLRTVDKPKKKKWHHVQVIKQEQKIEEITNERIKRVIKLYQEKK